MATAQGIDMRNAPRHGHAFRNGRSPEYRAWDAIHRGYGGAKVCERWIFSFENFIADVGLKPGWDYWLMRIDPKGDYTPENCEWRIAPRYRKSRRP